MSKTVDALDDISLSGRQVETAVEVASPFPTQSLPTTKIRIPQLPSSLLPRPALLQRLQAWRRHSLTLITAPTGYGKTTIAACALNRDAPLLDVQRYWLALDEDDDSPVHFVQSLSQALLPLISKSTGVAELVHLSRSETQRAILLLLREVEKQRLPVVVVLDDFHRIQEHEVHQLFALALERTPPNLHWMVLSRYKPPFSLGRLRLQRQVVEFTIEDLALSDTELAAYLEIHQIHPNDTEMVHRLQARIGGWLAGLQLALISLQHPNHTEPNPSPVDLNNLLVHLHGESELLAEYLTGEVLAHLPEPLRSFLLRCSILRKLHPDLCVAVTGQEESRRLLHEASAQQLFLRALDEKGEWYEFHHLFRELLLYHLRLEASKEEIQTLYRRAADWFLAAGDMTAALRALVAGDAAHLAAELVQSRSQQALLACRLEDLRQWEAILPADQIDTHPRLLLDLAWLRAVDGTGLADAVERALGGIAAYPSPPQSWQDEVETLTLLNRYHNGDRHKIHHDALTAIKQFDEHSHLARGWAYMIAYFTRSQAAERDNPIYIQKADNAFSAAGYARGQIYIIAMQSQHSLHIADIGALQEHYRQAEQIVAQQSQPDPMDLAFLSGMLGEALYWQNQLFDAAHYLKHTRTIAQARLDPANLLLAQAILHLCAQADAAIEIPASLNVTDYDEQWRQMREFYPIGVQSIQILWEIRLAISRGELSRVWKLFEKLEITLDTLSKDAPDAAWLCLLTAYTIDGRQLEALTPYLDMMLARGRETQSPYITIQVNLLRTRQLRQLGRHSAARGALRQALQETEATGYIRMVLDSPDLIPLLHQTGSKYAQQLLAQMQPRATKYRQRFSPREQDLLALLAEEFTVAQISERLVLSPATTRSYLSRLYAKLGVKNHAEAVAQVGEKK